MSENLLVNVIIWHIVFIDNWIILLLFSVVIDFHQSYFISLRLIESWLETYLDLWLNLLYIFIDLLGFGILFQDLINFLLDCCLIIFWWLDTFGIRAWDFRYGQNGLELCPSNSNNNFIKGLNELSWDN